MPKGKENPEIVLHGTGLRVYLDRQGPSIHINADGKVWLDPAGQKSGGKYLTSLK